MPKTKILIYEQPKAKVKEEPEIMCACVLARLIYNALKSNTRTVLKEGGGGKGVGLLARSLLSSASASAAASAAGRRA